MKYELVYDLQYISDSKRFVPELVNFLSSAVACFSKSTKCEVPCSISWSCADHVTLFTGIFLPPFSAKCKIRKDLAVMETAEVLTNSTT